MKASVPVVVAYVPPGLLCSPVIEVNKLASIHACGSAYVRMAQLVFLVAF